MDADDDDIRPLLQYSPDSGVSRSLMMAASRRRRCFIEQISDVISQIVDLTLVALHHASNISQLHA